MSDRAVRNHEERPGMSAHRTPDDTVGLDLVTGGGAPAEPGPANAATATGPVMSAEDLLLTPPTDDDLADQLAVDPRRGRPSALTSVLAVLALVAVGFGGGAYVQKHLGSAGGTGAAPAAAAGGTGTSGGIPGGSAESGGFPGGGTGTGSSGAGGGTGSGGGQTGGTSFTSGTVTKVVGSTVYVKGSDGTVTKVTTGSSTKVTLTRSAKVGQITKGTTVTVTGTSGNGSLTATSISQGSAGGFGPGGFGGGGSGGSAPGGGGTAGG